MEVSPWPFLAVGLLVGGVAAVFLIYTHIAKGRISAHALELLHKGASPAQACEQLVAEGNDATTCAQIVEKAVHRIEIGWATALLEKGASKGDAIKELAATGVEAERASDLVREASLLRWCHRWRYAVGPAGGLLFLLGIAVIFFGLVLRDGNRTGKFVTFPYAGGLTIMLGVMVLCFGLVLLAGVFKSSF